MPEITFKVETEAAITRLELEEAGPRFIPIDHNNNVGSATLPSGYDGVVVLVLQGQQGQTAVLRITQKVGALDELLAELTEIAITNDNGEASVFAAFLVQ